MKYNKSVYFALFSVLFVIVINFTIVIMAAPYIVSDLGGSTDTSIYTVAFFGLGTALGVPLGKPMGARMGAVNALVYSLLLFTFFTFLCAIAPNYPLFIGARFLQGVVGGPFYPLFSYLLVKVCPPERLTHAIATVVTMLALGPVFAACWGGFIAYELFWQLIFLCNLPFLLLLAFFLWHRLVPILPDAPEKTPFDGVGYFFYFVGIFTLSFAAIMAQELDWYRSTLLVACTLIGIPCFIFFLLWTWRSPSPILELHFFKKFAFSFGMFYLGCCFALYFGTITLLPLWLTLYVEYTQIWIGLLLGIMVVSGFIPPLLIGEKLLGRFDPRISLSIAILLIAISCFHTTVFNIEVDFARIAVSRVTAGFGLAFLLPPIFQLCFKSFPNNRAIDIITLFQVVRNLSGGVGASLCHILWQRRQVFFHERLGEQITLLDPQTRAFFQRAKQLLLPGDAAAQLNSLLDKQARVLGLDDAFYLFGWILIALFLLILFTIPFKFHVRSQEE